MAKKKAAIADEATQIQGIIDQEASKQMGVPVKNGNIVEPAEPEAPKVEPEDEKVTDFDPDKFAEETAQKAADKLKEYEKEKEEQKERERLEKESKSKEDEELIPIFKREGRNPKDYEEIVNESNRIAELKVKKMLEERDRQALAKSEEEAKAREAELAKSKQFEEDFNKMIDEEVAELYQNDKLPKVVNAEDPNDPGVKAKFELFKTMREVNEKRVKAGQTPITSVSRIFNNYYKPKDQPAGSDAPISDGRGSAHTEDKELGYTYADLKKPWLSFFRKK